MSTDAYERLKADLRIQWEASIVVYEPAQPGASEAPAVADAMMLAERRLAQARGSADCPSRDPGYGCTYNSGGSCIYCRERHPLAPTGRSGGSGHYTAVSPPSGAADGSGAAGRHAHGPAGDTSAVYLARARLDERRRAAIREDERRRAALREQEAFVVEQQRAAQEIAQQGWQVLVEGMRQHRAEKDLTP